MDADVLMDVVHKLVQSAGLGFAIMMSTKTTSQFMTQTTTRTMGQPR